MEQAPKEVAMSAELKSYKRLRVISDSSPGVPFTMVLREEVGVQQIMAELRGILEKKKDTKKAHLEQGKAQVAEEELTTVDNFVQVESCLEKLNEQIQQEAEIARLISLKLKHVAESVARLPASNRDNIQPCYNSLRAEARIAISKIASGIKILCQENQIRVHELTSRW